MKKVHIHLNHPAHFHLFKNTIRILRDKGHVVIITHRKKDILEELLIDHDSISVGNKYYHNLFGKIYGSCLRSYELSKIIKKFKPDLLAGTAGVFGRLGLFFNIPSLFFGEDDVNLSLLMYVGALNCYPLFTKILSPKGCNNSIWDRKTIFYSGYQKLAYLHPNQFTPDRTKVDIPENEEFFIMRFASLKAYHDVNAKGIDDELAKQIISILSKRGRVIITSERKLPEEFREYEFNGNKNDIHHYLFFASLYIGDSQSMAVESAMLGTPNIRFNDFVGRISVLEEIERKYGLSIGINSNNPNLLLTTIVSMLGNSSINEEFKRKRKKMLADKIDVTAFMVWFIENYPESAKIMKDNPHYQYRFK